MAHRGEILPGSAPDAASLIFMDEQERSLFVEAHMGEQARSFVCSDLGRLMLARADEEVQRAKDAALDISPWSPLAKRRLRQAKFKAAVAQQFSRWLAEAIQHGDEAYQQLKAREQ